MKCFPDKTNTMKTSLLWVRIVSTLFVFMTPLFYVSASEDMVLQKYVYGLRQVKEEKYFPPLLEPVSNIELNENGTIKKVYSFYNISDNESELVQEKHLINIHLGVRQENNHALATVSFYNRSQQSYFVHRSRLDEPKSSPFYPLCSHTFSIATDNIRLIYLAKRCQFEDESNDKESNWLELPAGKTFSYTVILNDAYLFPPGNRRYNIGSMEFLLASDIFFHEKRVNKFLFSILDWKYYSCITLKNANYLRGVNGLCKVQYRWKKDTIKGLMYKFYHYGLNSDNYFEIRSNQVVVEINGNKLTSPYDMKTTQFTD